MATILPGLSLSPRPRYGANAWRRNPPLAALVLAMVGVAVVALVGLAVDPRVITGAPAWMKPLKFAVSIAIYGGTLLWMLTFIPERSRLVAVISWGVLFVLGLEMVLIVMQVLRNTTSHFNQATPFDAAVFGAMGIVIAVLWMLNATVAFLLSRRRFAEAPIVWGVRLGLVAGLLGMAVAFLMTQPTPEQDALIAITGSSSVVGAHSVGVVDGGPGLPIVGWSTVGGDLRVAHFVGLHALQALPLVGIALTQWAPSWLSMRDRSRLVGVAGASWVALVILLTWQALRGQSVVAPDVLSLAMLAALVTIAAGASIAVISGSRSRHAHEGMEVLAA